MIGGIAILLFTALVGASASFVVKRRDSRTYGPRIAQQYLRLRLKLFAFVFVSGLLFLTARRVGIPWMPQLRSAALLAAALTQIVFLLRWRTRREEAGALLVDLHRHRDWKRLVGIGSVVLIAGGINLATVATGGSVNWKSIPLSLLLLISGSAMIAAGLIHLELRTDGVVRFPRVHSWNDIVAYRFEPGEKNLLSLTLPDSFWSVEKELHLPVSPALSQEVASVLESNGVVAVDSAEYTELLKGED